MRALITLSLMLVASSACHIEKERSKLRGFEAMHAGEVIRSASIERAIISQHTLYPYHFIAGTAKLNELGRRDLMVLVRHFEQASGELNLARGDAADTLYKARSEALAEELRSAGIAKDRVRVTAGSPGGDGISGSRLVKILEVPSGPLGATPKASGGTGASSSASRDQQ